MRSYHEVTKSPHDTRSTKSPRSCEAEANERSFPTKCTFVYCLLPHTKLIRSEELKHTSNSHQELHTHCKMVSGFTKYQRLVEELLMLFRFSRYEVWNFIGVNLLAKVLFLGTQYYCCMKGIGLRSKNHCLFLFYFRLFFSQGTETYPNIPKHTRTYLNMPKHTRRHMKQQSRTIFFKKVHQELLKK